MKSKTLIWLVITAITMTSISCKKESKKKGCTDPSSMNFDEDADDDNGTCAYVMGTYFIQESCNSALLGANNDSYTLTIQSNDGVNLVINNLGNAFDNILAKRSGNAISLWAKSGIQDKVSHYTWDFDGGTGTISQNGKTLTLSYSFDDILYNDVVGWADCSITGSK